MRVIVVGAGVGGLVSGVRLAHAGHAVQVLESAPAPGGKCAQVHQGAFMFDAGPSLLTMPQVFRAVFAETGAPLDDELELMRVEPVTRYGFADGSSLDLSADLPTAIESLEAWAQGTGRDWMSFLATCTRMWAASDTYLNSLSLWPPRRPQPGQPTPKPLDALRVRPWSTVRGLARAHTSDPRLQMVIERFATYAGADPRRAPAALALSGYVEHAFGAWYPRGGMYTLVQALVRRFTRLGGELTLNCPVHEIRLRGGSVHEVITDAGAMAADAVVSDIDEAVLKRHLLTDNGRLAFAPQQKRRSGRTPGAHTPSARSLSGLTLLLGLSGREESQPHHLIQFPLDYDAEFDDLFIHRRPVREPTLYVSSPTATDPASAPAGCEKWLVLANAPAIADTVDWSFHTAEMIQRLGVKERIIEQLQRTPGDLEHATGALGGAIYGAAPHGRLATVRRPGNRVPGADGLFLVGGTVHPGGGLPIVTLGAANVAREIGPA